MPRFWRRGGSSRRARTGRSPGAGNSQPRGGIVGGILKVVSMEFGGLFSLYVFSSIADTIMPLINGTIINATCTTGAAPPYTVALDTGTRGCSWFNATDLCNPAFNWTLCNPSYFAGIETYASSFFPLLGLLIVVLPVYWFVRRYMR